MSNQPVTCGRCGKKFANAILWQLHKSLTGH